MQRRPLKSVVCSIAWIALGAAVAAAQTIEPIGPLTAENPAPQAIEPAVAPNGPVNLQAQAVQSTVVALLWDDKSNNETSFDVEARTADQVSFVPVGSTGANAVAVFVSGLASGNTYFFRVRATNASGSSAYSNVASVTTLDSDTPCTPTATTMCLNSSRFRVRASYWTPQDGSGDGQVVKLTDDSGYLWFFNSTNIEAIVKVLNGCPTTIHRYWNFAGGLTNVRVLLSVTDTGVSPPQTKAYINPQGTAFQPIQDTEAFATCP